MINIKFMKMEKPNLDSIISEIKEIEKDELKENKLEEQNEEMNPELKKLLKYSERIFEIAKNYESVYSFLEPMGVNLETGELRSFDEEFDDFLEKRKKDSNYCPSMLCPELEKIDTSRIDDNLKELKEIQKDASGENKYIEENVFWQIEPIITKINFLIEAKNENLEESFELSKQAYGDIDEGLCKNAINDYDETMDLLENVSPKSDLEKLLEENEFDAEDLKEFFELALRKGELEKDFKVVIEKGISNMSVSYGDLDHPYNVILIPENRIVNGAVLIRKLAHELTHVTAHTFSPKQGIYLGGKDSEPFTEAIAQKSEDEIMIDVLGEKEGKEFLKYRMDDYLFYVLAMEQVGKGFNFAQTYDYIFNKKYEELLSRNGYYETKNKKETSEIKEKSEDKAMKFSKRICWRIFRGFDSKEGGKYFTKDMIYYKGKMGLAEMEKEGVDKYLYMSRIDPALIPSLKKLGAYANEKGLSMAREAVKQIWQDKGWPVDYIKDKKWYEENTQMDRHWAYRKEFMNEDMTDVTDDKIREDMDEYFKNLEN